MRRKPNAVLAESNRAAVAALAIAPDAIRIQAGERGWRSRWIEPVTGGHVLILVDDGSRIGDLSWAATQREGEQVRVGFLGAGPPDFPSRSAIEQLVASRLGWSRLSGRRDGIAIFDSPAGALNEQALALAVRLLNPDRSGKISEWQVGFIGSAGPSLFGDWGRSWYLTPSLDGSVEEMVGGRLDLLFVDDDPVGWHDAGVRSTVEEFRRLGTRPIGLSTGSNRKSYDGLDPPVDLQIRVDARGRGVDIGPGVDVRLINPMGFRRESEPTIAAVASMPLRSVERRLDEDSVTSTAHLIDGAGVTRATPATAVLDAAELVRSLRPYRAVLDHPRLHGSETKRARLLTWMACAGIPVVAEEITEGLGQMLGLEMSRLLARGDIASMGDPDLRELYSVELRRAALREVSLSARLRDLGQHIGLSIAPLPTVSVLMATKRPEYLEHALSQLAKQTYPDLEVVLGLHGDAFPADVERRLRALTGFSVQVARFDDSKNLGDVLNGAAARASGRIVSKWDDDDWYGPEHIWDVVLAMEYSGADAVGKAAEFVYVADLDITIRRFPEGAESPSRTLAGGTLTLGSDTLGSIGGFPSVPRHVDEGLLNRLTETGGTTFRTQGLGYLLNRHGEHTWNIATDYFLDGSFRQWRGLSLGPPGIESAATAGAGLEVDHPGLHDLRPEARAIARTAD